MPLLPLIPEIRWIGYHAARRASPWYPHFHDKLLEVHYLESGMIPSLIGTEVVQLSGGQAFAVLPHEVHGGRYQVLGPSKLYWLSLAFDATEPRPAGDDEGRKAPALLGLTTPEAAALTSALRGITRRVFVASPAMVQAFHALRSLLPSRTDPMAVVQIRSAVLTVLTEAARAADQSQPERSGVLVSEAIRLIESQLGSPQTIEALSKQLGWSRQHVQEAFREQVGVGPGDYWLCRRVMEGCRLLETTELTVTEIAHRLGFGSSQYFGTAFKRLMGATPRGFRRMVASAPLREPHLHALPNSPR